MRYLTLMMIAALLSSSNLLAQDDSLSTSNQPEGLKKAAPAVAQAETGFPLSQEECDQIERELKTILEHTESIDDERASAVDQHSRRGDALFFLRRFSEAIKHYEAMVRLKPALDASHWRLGIAYFFDDKPQQAAAQFEKYHSFDDVDRENGIWRYLSQFKATGASSARKELIRYQKDDREPFPAVYKLFDDTLTPEQALESIPQNLSPDEADKRFFYTELYIGMHMVVKKQKTEATRFLSRAVARKWPRKAGYGPNFMWHVARLQLLELQPAFEEHQKAP